MAQITGGKVSVEDSKPHSNDEYGRKKVLVELSFAVGDGEEYEAVFDLASEAADNRVRALLDGVSLRTVGGTDASPPALGDKPKRIRRTNAQIAEDNARRASAQGQNSETASSTTEASELALPNTGGSDDAASLDDGLTLPGEEPALEDDDAASLGEEDWNVGGEEPEPVNITDAELTSAVTRRNGELKDPELIRSLIATYNPEPTKPFQLRQIAADKRAGFLKALAELKKSA